MRRAKKPSYDELQLSLRDAEQQTLMLKWLAEDMMMFKKPEDAYQSETDSITWQLWRCINPIRNEPSSHGGFVVEVQTLNERAQINVYHLDALLPNVEAGHGDPEFRNAINRFKHTRARLCRDYLVRVYHDMGQPPAAVAGDDAESFQATEAITA